MTKKILIGDDQIGSAAGRALRTLFEMKYESAFSGYTLEYTADPEEFLKMAESKEYSALFIDLKWGIDLPREGYRLLQESKEYSPIRILWTSEEDEARQKGYEHGATHCLEKNPSLSKLEEILK